MSTADHAGRPLGSSASSTGSTPRRGTSPSGSPASGSGDGGALRRMAGGDATTASTSAPTAPVPVRSAPDRATSSEGAPAAAAKKPAPRPSANRRVRLTVSRVDPWSAMKISFLLSVALGIAMVVMVFVLWTILAGMGVFDQINGVIGQVVQDGQNRFDIMDFIGLPRVLSLSVVVAVIDVVLITAISTLAAFLYNVSSALVGGVQLTLTDD
ncbi:DUF3566 domain-containing protein [Oryzobacter telluris]|uniref:DUF3566 domain-containing protein n=1 Tax=Oryzobacter telluris TaxID=3149179 RepID=UPI00370D8A6A